MRKYQIHFKTDCVYWYYLYQNPKINVFNKFDQTCTSHMYTFETLKSLQTHLDTLTMLYTYMYSMNIFSQSNQSDDVDS